MKTTQVGIKRAVDVIVLAVLSLAGGLVASAQPNLPPTWVFARAYNGWTIIGQQANTYTFNGGVCNYSPYNNGNTAPFFVFSGLNSSSTVYYPVAILDASTANSEIVTPTSTTQTSAACGFAASTSHSHTSFTLSSGTAGLQEAIITQQQSTPVFSVILDKYWYQQVAGLPGTPSGASIIASVTGNVDVGIVDTTTMPWTFYAWNGSSYTTASQNTAATVVTAAPGSVRAIIGAITTTASTYANGSNNITGVRGSATIPAGTTETSGYVYGTQGKYVLAGTVNGSTWNAGLQGQVDISAATLTAASHITPLWSDAGATGPAVTCAFCDSVVLTNTTATTFNSLIYGYSTAGYLMDLSNNGSAFINGSTATGGSVTGYLKIKINGVDAYIAYKGTPGT